MPMLNIIETAQNACAAYYKKEEEKKTFLSEFDQMKQSANIKELIPALLKSAEHTHVKKNIYTILYEIIMADSSTKHDAIAKIDKQAKELNDYRQSKTTGFFSFLAKPFEQNFLDYYNDLIRSAKDFLKNDTDLANIASAKSKLFVKPSPLSINSINSVDSVELLGEDIGVIVEKIESEATLDQNATNLTEEALHNAKSELEREYKQNMTLQMQQLQQKLDVLEKSNQELTQKVQAYNENESKKHEAEVKLKFLQYYKEDLKFEKLYEEIKESFSHGTRYTSTNSSPLLLQGILKYFNACSHLYRQQFLGVVETNNENLNESNRLIRNKNYQQIVDEVKALEDVALHKNYESGARLGLYSSQRLEKEASKNIKLVPSQLDNVSDVKIGLFSSKIWSGNIFPTAGLMYVPRSSGLFIPREQDKVRQEKIREFFKELVNRFDPKTIEKIHITSDNDKQVAQACKDTIKEQANISLLTEGMRNNILDRFGIKRRVMG